MFEEPIGKKATLTKVAGDGTAGLWNLTGIKGEGCLVTLMARGWFGWSGKQTETRGAYFFFPLRPALAGLAAGAMF
jgi:hypothetical protein